VLSWLLWAAGYAAWLTTVRDVARNAARGHVGHTARLVLLGFTLVGGIATALEVQLLAGMGMAFLSFGVVLVAWHALSRATRLQAIAVARLNRVAADLELLRRRPQ